MQTKRATLSSEVQQTITEMNIFKLNFTEDFYPVSVKEKELLKIKEILDNEEEDISQEDYYSFQEKFEKIRKWFYFSAQEAKAHSGFGDKDKEESNQASQWIQLSRLRHIEFMSIKDLEYENIKQLENQCQQNFSQEMELFKGIIKTRNQDSKQNPSKNIERERK